MIVTFDHLENSLLTLDLIGFDEGRRHNCKYTTYGRFIHCFLKDITELIFHMLIYKCNCAYSDNFCKADHNLAIIISARRSGSSASEAAALATLRRIHSINVRKTLARARQTSVAAA